MDWENSLNLALLVPLALLVVWCIVTAIKKLIELAEEFGRFDKS